MMEPPRCVGCLFCEELLPDFIRCTNADVAQDAGWDETYLMQGYLDLPLPQPGAPPCFWFVQKR
ncbi:MAG: hypothetical protein HY910_15075 [Desulfarculus sp.]|nr:hypothetical protein [Desulfarculus sp.]